MNNAIQHALTTLNLRWLHDHLDEEIAEAARKQRTPYELIERLLEGELQAREGRSIERRFRHAKLPGRPTLQAYDFHWPASINADLVRHLFSLEFMRNASPSADGSSSSAGWAWENPIWPRLSAPPPVKND